MKLITLLMILGIMQVSAATFAQKVTLKDKDASLKEVFNQISIQTGYDFVVTSDLLGQSKPITIEVNNAELPDVLHIIFDNQPLAYTLQEKTVVVSQKQSTLLDKLKSAFEQTTIRGKVVDSLGYPIPGVTVQEKGIQNATFTDNKGYYSITVENNNAAIIFSYVGYQTREISIKDLLPLITLHPAENNLHEVVINKGYYYEKEALTTGSVSVVNAKTIGEQVVDDPLKAIEGYVPGIQITQSSGYNGSNETVRIRGINSINSGLDPLYVIDGVPFSPVPLTPNLTQKSVLNNNSNPQSAAGLSPFSAFNLQDIASIEVLKDADATAIYGSRGANGVILITTKKGKAGDTKVDVDFSQGVSQVAHFMDMMNTQQYLQMRHQAFALDGIPYPSITTNPTDNNYDVNGVWDTTRNTNWQKALLGNSSHYTNAQVSISGGTENTQFRVSSGFTRNTNVLPESGYADEKGSLNFSLNTTSANKRFQFQLNGSYAHDNNNLPSNDLTQFALSEAPDAPALYNANGGLNWEDYQGSATWSNPLAPLVNSNTMITDNVNGNAVLSYLILPGLKIQTSAGYTDDRVNQTDLTFDAAQAPPNNLLPNNRSNSFGNTQDNTWIIEPQLNYSRKVGNGELDALVGSTFEQQTSESSNSYAYGFSSDALVVNASNATNFSFGGSSTSEYRYNDIKARLGYTWDDKYILNLTGSRDGSSDFGSGKQFGNFGSIGAAWIFSKEKIISDNLPWLSFGKLHVSYGTTGNQGGAYQYLSSYGTNSLTYQGITGLNPLRIPNPYYSWEIDKKLDIGLDLSFLKDRINFSAEYYRQRSGNELVGESLPYTTGFSSVEYNLPAVLQNTGTEFSLNTINVKTSSFRWSTNFNFSFAPSSTLISFPGLASSGYQYQYEIGKSVYFYPEAIVTGVNPKDGVYEFWSPSGPTENPAYLTDFQWIERPHQQWYGGFGNSFSYKGFELDFLFQFVKQTQYNYYSFVGEDVATAGIMNYNMPVNLIGKTWTGPGSTAEFGRLSTEVLSDPNYETFNPTNIGLVDGSFIRLKNAALSYTLPESWQQAIRMSNVRVYLQGQNLLTFDHYLGMDPETGPVNLPPLRTITFGIHASL